MGILRITTVESNYKETDIKLKEQFSHEQYDSEMIIEIIKELKKWRRMKT